MTQEQSELVVFVFLTVMRRTGNGKRQNECTTCNHLAAEALVWVLKRLIISTNLPHQGRVDAAGPDVINSGLETEVNNSQISSYSTWIESFGGFTGIYDITFLLMPSRPLQISEKITKDKKKRITETFHLEKTRSGLNLVENCVHLYPFNF